MNSRFTMYLLLFARIYLIQLFFFSVSLPFCFNIIQFTLSSIAEIFAKIKLCLINHNEVIKTCQHYFIFQQFTFWFEQFCFFLVNTFTYFQHYPKLLNILNNKICAIFMEIYCFFCNLAMQCFIQTFLQQ